MDYGPETLPDEQIPAVRAQARRVRRQAFWTAAAVTAAALLLP